MHGPAIMSYLLFFFVMPPTYFRLLPLSLTEHDQCPACCLPYYSELFQPSLPDNLLVLTGEIHTSLQNWHRATGILCVVPSRVGSIRPAATICCSHSAVFQFSSFYCMLTFLSFHVVFFSSVSGKEHFFMHAHATASFEKCNPGTLTFQTTRPREQTKYRHG